MTFFIILALKGRDGQDGLPGLDGLPGEVVSNQCTYIPNLCIWEKPLLQTDLINRSPVKSSQKLSAISC